VRKSAARWRIEAVELHRDIGVRALSIGAERAPLLVVDNFVADADRLVQIAAAETFTEQSRYYPGIRAEAPAAYQQVFAAGLHDAITAHFGLRGGALRFSLCAFSLVTTPADRLMVPQRIPHVDSLAGSGLASIHYLFKRDLGGTAFYRHRKTGFEYVDESRNEKYLESLRAENLRPETAGDGYINGDTPLFEQIARHDGVFNRLLIYRRNSLHSGCIARDFVADADPARGRLSINSFIDMGD
jgi:hypothetical protein